MQDTKVINYNIREGDQAAKIIAASQKHKEQGAQGPDAMLAAWMVIFECIVVATGTTETFAKQIQNSVATQTTLLQEQSQIYLVTLANTKGVTTAQLTQLETQNQIAMAQRGIIGDQMTSEQQGTSIFESLLSTKLNEINQSQQEDGSIPQILINLSNRIVQI